MFQSIPRILFYKILMYAFYQLENYLFKWLCEDSVILVVCDN